MQVLKTKPGYREATLIPPYIKFLIPEDWNVIILQEITKNHNSGIFKNQEFYGKGVNIVGVSNLYSHTKIDGQIFRLVTLTEEEKKDHVLEKGDLIYGESSLVKTGIGKTLYVTKKGAGTYFAWHTRRFKINNDALPIFIYYMLDFSKLRNSIINRSTTTALTGVTTKDFFETKIPLPSIKEQQKITSILSNVDDLIQKTDQLIKKTKILKIGLMQKLLTKGIGHTKFKYENFGLRYLTKRIPNDWEVKRIGKVCRSIVPGRNKPKKFNGNIPWLTVDDFEQTFVHKSKNNLKVSREELKKSSGKIIPTNSVLMSCVGELGILSINTTDISMNQQLHAFICPNYLQPFFLLLFLKTMKSYMNAIATKTTVAYMNKDNCESIPIIIPPMREQQKIISILSNIDLRIYKLELDKSNLKILKKGLMQKLLTGKIKVN